MVIKQKLWEGQTEYEFGNVLLKNNPFDLIVTGDNHKSFTFKDEDRYLVNCGSLMRSSIDQIDHEPVVYIYDSDKRTLEKLLIPVKAISNIMRIEEAQQEKEKNEKLIAFVEGLKEDTQIEGLDFLNNLKSYLDNNDVDQGVKNIIEEIING
jgi:DNA repair exonuclease SbcCD nuclease subunit